MLCSKIVGVVLAMTAMGFVSACSSDAETTNSREKVGDIRQNQTWTTGTKLVGVVRIVEGVTVEIEPGARIGCTEAAQIQLGGTLRAKGSGKRITLTCSGWRGILVARNGSIDFDGVDLENPEVGIETTKGAGTVTLNDSTITNSVRPLRVGAESTVTVTKSKFTTPTTLTTDFNVSVTEVYGTLIAKYLEYEANTNEGIMTMRDGVVDIEDSTLTGSAGYDLVSSYGGKSVKVRYTTMRGAHCGPHIAESKDADKAPTGSLEIDHVTSENNIWGITIYATSVQGPVSIKDSNFQGVSGWLDLQGPHGPLVFDNVFINGNQQVANTDPPTINKATARIEDAKPR